NPKELALFYMLKPHIFNPQSLEEIKAVDIRIVPVTSENSETYRALYIFTSSALYNGAPGHRMSYIIMDGTSNKYMGLITQNSEPAPNLATRDEEIGWTEDDRIAGKKLQHIYNGQTLVAFKPFSFNCLGGKLMARLLVTEPFRNAWLERTGHVPVAACTTSLYGASDERDTQYDGIKEWKRLWQTSGKTPLELPEHLVEHWKADYNIEAGRPIAEGGRADETKRTLNRIIRDELGLPSAFMHHGIRRGVYWCPFFQNTKHFLCGRTSKLVPLGNCIHDMNYQI